MANYVNPMDLLREYLVPPTGAINTGMEQGIKLRTLRNAEAVENAMIPYRRAQAEHLRAQTTAIPLATQHAADTLALEKAKEAGVQGIPMTDQMSKLLTGQELPRQDISVPGMEGPNEQAIRTMVKPNIEGLKIIPTNPVPGRGFQAEDYEGATKFDVSGKIPVMPLSRKQQELVAAHDKAVEIANLTADRAKEVANINKAGRIEAATISAGKPQRPNEIELITQDLRNTLRREPTAGEILKKQQDIKNTGSIPDIGKIGTTPPGVRNEEAIQDLTPGQAAVVKQLVDYKINLPSGMALRTPYWQGMLERASVYDTSFDATQYNVRMAVKRDFTSGKSAQNIKSLNTAVNHLDTLNNASKELENRSLQWWNTAANYGLTKTGDPRVTKFYTAATAIEGELANVFKNTGATDQEIKAWRTNLDASQSPEQLRGNVAMVIDLLFGRLGALQSQYEVGLGKPKDFTFLNDKSRAILKKLNIDVDKLDPKPEGNAPNSKQPKWDNKVPQAAIDYLKAHPEQAVAFDAKYGNGNKVSQHFLGEK